MSRKKVVHVNKSKDQLIADLQKNQKWVAKMKFTREQFYPALVELDESVEDTKMFIASINGVMEQKFLASMSDLMKEKKFGEIKLKEVLDKKEKNYEKYVAILDLFNDHSVFDAKDCIEGMKGELDLFVRDEMSTRKMSTLKPKWMDEL